MKRLVAPIKVLQRILNDLKTAIESEKTLEGDFTLRLGMLEGLNAMKARLNTWTVHQRNISKLEKSGERRRVTKEVTLSEGRYRKYEWYEGKRFFSLAFRWGTKQPEPEIGLEIQSSDTLYHEFLVYKGGLSYDDLLTAAKRSGKRGIWGGQKTSDWIPLDH